MWRTHAMWECGKGVANFLFFCGKNFIEWFLYLGNIYACIYNPYVHELRVVHVHMD